MLAVVAPAQGNGSWEQGFDHCISPTTFPFGTDPTTPFQGAPDYIPPPTPPNVGSASPQVYAANYFWGEGQLFANVHKRAFNAVHMALIPKWQHQGKVLVFGSWWPVLLRPNSTLEPAHKDWFCQAWSVIDPDTSRVPTPAEPRFLNYLLPLRPRTSPVVEDVQPPALVLGRSPGAQFTVTCEKIEALDQVDHVVLMAPGSVTHHFDMSARYVLLGGGHVGGNNKTWQFQLPDAGTLPRGYYMMFALNNAGIPSVATWVQVQ